MAPRTDATGQIQKRQTSASQPKLSDMLLKMQSQIAMALPKHVTADRMTRLFVTALNSNEKLQQCTPVSFLGCVMQLSQLGLEANTPLGHAYLIPRWNGKKRVLECTMQIGYQGFIELGSRAGARVYAHVVREGDLFKRTLGLRKDLIHEPSDADDYEQHPITHVYAVAVHRDYPDNPQFECLTRGQVFARRDRSSNVQQAREKDFQTPWDTDEEAMFRKTAVRALWTWMTKSVELSRAIAVDLAAEDGRAQFTASTVDPVVANALAAQGLRVDDDDASIVDTPAQLESGDQRVDELAAAVQSTPVSAADAAPATEPQQQSAAAPAQSQTSTQAPATRRAQPLAAKGYPDKAVAGRPLSELALDQLGNYISHYETEIQKPGLTAHLKGQVQATLQAAEAAFQQLEAAAAEQALDGESSPQDDAADALE